MSNLQLRVNLLENGQGTRQRYQLDGEFYEFVFRYCGVSDAWFFDLYDDDGAAIVTGIAIVVSESLASDGILDLIEIVNYKAEAPPGRLFAFDTSGDQVESGLNDIDERVVLLYEEAS